MSVFSKKHEDGPLLSIKDFGPIRVDTGKITMLAAELRLGVKNHLYRQKYPRHRWPLWVSSSLPRESLFYRSQSSPCLLNTTRREGMTFSNFLSSEELHIDRAGMISPSYSAWSLELWIAGREGVVRAADRAESFKMERDLKDAAIRSTWEEKAFRVDTVFYGARTSLDEALADIRVNVKEKTGARFLIVAVRPYNIDELGTVTSLRYAKDTRTVQVDGHRSIHVSAAPESVHVSSAGLGCDIDLEERGGPEVSCPEGMASMALAFPLKAGENALSLRMALDGKKDLAGGKIQYAKLKQEFSGFAALRLDGGMSVQLPDKFLSGWVRAAKIAMMNFTGREVFRAGASPDFAAGYGIVTAFHRMGYVNESAELIDGMSSALRYDEKHFTFRDAVAVACVISSMGDHFASFRDTEYLQVHFGYMKKLAAPLLAFTSKIRKAGGLKTNSIARSFIAGEHPVDYALFCHAFSHYSYCARCLGIFGEELSFAAEEKRLGALLEGILQGPAPFGGDFAGQALFAVTSLAGSSSDDAVAAVILERVRGTFGEPPFVAPSAGVDIHAALAMCASMARAKEPGTVQALLSVLSLSQWGMTLPEFADPRDRGGLRGEGDSKMAAAMVFTVIRSLLFQDSAERLVMFPVPQESWFAQGTEIKVAGAPSRYGILGFRAVSNAEEIQVHFDDLPKFVPPEIVIHLPVKARIVPDDDFIVKKEFESSFVISGWPSILKFMRA